MATKMDNEKIVKVNISKSIATMSVDVKKALLLALAEIGARTSNAIKQLPAKQSFIDRTGNLRQHIIPQSIDEKRLSIKVIAQKEYGLYVNDGTKYIKPRKFMERGTKNASKDFEAILKRKLSEAI